MNLKIKVVLCILILVCNIKITEAQELNANQKEHVTTFIQNFKNKDIDAIAKNVTYPLRRKYPVAAIKDEKDFIKNYKQLFDSDLENKIINSDLNADWSTVGWRGIMFNNGDLWLDYGGNLIALNYQTKVEVDIEDKLIAQDKDGVYKTLKNFERPVLILETSKFRIRIDELKDHKYRYASWTIASKMTDKPSLILYNGTFIAEGSGGNHKYVFKNGKYSYECYINVLGASDTPPANLIVYKNGKEILSQRATLIK